MKYRRTPAVGDTGLKGLFREGIKGRKECKTGRQVLVSWPYKFWCRGSRVGAPSGIGTMIGEMDEGVIITARVHILLRAVHVWENHAAMRCVRFLPLFRLLSSVYNHVVE